jgi:hypothetical protein
MKRLFPLFLIVLWTAMVFAGCKRSQPLDENLPLPPVGDSGLSSGSYIQAEYGFSLPIPKGFGSYAPDQEDQPAEEFDEWIRFMDTKKDTVVRLFTEDLEQDRGFSESDAKKAMGEVFTSGEYEVKTVGKTLVWPVGKERWIVVPYDLKDKYKKEWRTWVCALARKDFVVWVRATLPLAQAQKGSGDSLVSAMKDCLCQVKWYQPVGPRGISLEHYELQKFDTDFIKALESGNVSRTLAFFDETTLSRFQWADRYKTLSAPVEGKGNSGPAVLKVQDAGLVINGKTAAIYFNFQNGKQAPVRLGFRLSKEGRSWNIISVEKTDKH